VEVSFDIESKVFIEFSLLWICLPFVSVDDVPLLVKSLEVLVRNDVSALSIYSSANVKDLAFFVDDLSILVSEEIPPS